MPRKYGNAAAYDEDDTYDYDDDFTGYSDEEDAAYRVPSAPVSLVSKINKPGPRPIVPTAVSNSKDMTGQVENQQRKKPGLKPIASVPITATNSTGVTEQMESQERKSKASLQALESHTSVHKESFQSKQKTKEQRDMGADEKALVFEGLADMNLHDDNNKRGKAAEQVNADWDHGYVPESWILEEIETERKPLLHLIVVGHVDAGKSTLMGHLLHLLGRVSQKEMHKNERESKQKGKGSFAYAWVLDEGSEERARGVTMTVAVAHLETPKLRVVLLDAPGHKDFVPNMISGAAQADAAVLVVDASLGAFEAGLDGEGQNSGQTREHAQLVRSLGVEQLVVAVNKMDAVAYSQQRFNFIKTSLLPFLKQCGFKGSAISWIPVSAINGQNLIVPPSAAQLTSWYTGSTLLDYVNLLEQPLRNTLKPLRLVIAELVKSRSLGQSSVSGKVESGAIRIGSKVLTMPMGEIATVKSLEQEGKAVNVALAGESVDVGLIGIEPAVLKSGGVLCHPDYPVPVATKLEVRVLILGIVVPILRGGQVILHAHHARESARIADLLAVLDSKTGAVIKKKPRFVTANQSALIEIVLERSVCLEEYGQFKSLGRVALRDSGKTLAVGIVTRILSQS